MTDDDLVVKIPRPPHKPAPGVRSANILSVVAIIISLFAALFAGLQWWEAHEARLLTQAPLLEITKAEFVAPTSLFLTLHNIGHAPALSVRGKNDAFIGWIGIRRSEYSKAFVRVMSYYGPSIPMEREAKIGAYMPEEEEIRRVQTEKKYPSPVVLELRGQVVYGAENGQTYTLPYCYIAMQSKPLPAAAECNNVNDDMLNNMKSR